VVPHGEVFGGETPAELGLMPGAAILLCIVVGIADGDTLTAGCDDQTNKVRLAEIDVPEKGQARPTKRPRAPLRARWLG
jgi:endonuclease YncB( thermonuclease family)